MNHAHFHRFVAALAAALPVLASAAGTPPPLAAQAADDYLKAARYPQWSQALEVGAADPLVESRIPTRQSRLGRNGAQPRLAVWASTISAQPGEAVTLFAALTRPAVGSLLEAAPAGGVSGATVTATLQAERLGDLGSITYRDDGAAPDTLAGDGIYTARYVLPDAPKPALGQADSVMVTTTALLADGDLRRAAGGFQFSNPSARLTGRYLDSLRDGSLVIAAEVEALAPGRVHLSGTLANAADEAFATAQTARMVAVGRQWIELTFYGLAFRDRGVSGAVKLASVALTSVNGMPNALGALVQDAYVTKPYLATQFTALPFGDPALLEQARRLQKDAALSAR